MNEQEKGALNPDDTKNLDSLDRTLPQAYGREEEQMESIPAPKAATPEREAQMQRGTEALRRSLRGERELEEKGFADLLGKPPSQNTEQNQQNTKES